MFYEEHIVGWERDLWGLIAGVSLWCRHLLATGTSHVTLGMRPHLSVPEFPHEPSPPLGGQYEYTQMILGPRIDLFVLNWKELQDTFFKILRTKSTE